ncbi:cathepsin d-like aspartic protease [Plakobranchus ocellatus]|uniref:Cathepsin d-like aspartic protease n=1 Tax=Plakobranchus ocellatus TaxID=259542 RepID=A0AAV4DG22_9GAST|nr:cathepsin d-like aspartic protease [Plakobranchus ocellatus]
MNPEHRATSFLTRLRRSSASLTPNEEMAEVNITNYNDAEFYGPIRIGTPGQVLNVIFDTSSADFWVPSVNCPQTNVPCLICWSCRARFPTTETISIVTASDGCPSRFSSITDDDPDLNFLTQKAVNDDDDEEEEEEEEEEKEDRSRRRRRKKTGAGGGAKTEKKTKTVEDEEEEDIEDDYYLTTMSLENGTSNCMILFSLTIFPEFHRKYINAASKTYRHVGKLFDIKYKRGKVLGFQSKDTVTVAGLPVKKQIFGEAMLQSEIFLEIAADGILGMGFSSLSQMGQPTVFDNMLSQGLVHSPVFSFYLSSHEKTPGGAGSVLTLGGTNPDLYTGNFTFVDVTFAQLWQFKLDGVKIPDKGESFCQKRCSAIVDSGSALITGPQEQTDKLNKKLGGSLHRYVPGMWVINCNRISEMPDVEFVVNETSLTLTSEEYIIKNIRGFRSNFEELKLPLNRSQSAVVILQECRLGEGQSPACGYTLLLPWGLGRAPHSKGTRFSEIDLKTGLHAAAATISLENTLTICSLSRRTL